MTLFVGDFRLQPQNCPLLHRTLSLLLVKLTWNLTKAISEASKVHPMIATHLEPFRIDMSAKNFRAPPATERTNVEGKPVRNKVLVAMPDDEYKLMRPDLAYIDLPGHLSLHEPP